MNQTSQRLCNISQMRLQGDSVLILDIQRYLITLCFDGGNALMLHVNILSGEHEVCKERVVIQQVVHLALFEVVIRTRRSKPTTCNRRVSGKTIGSVCIGWNMGNLLEQLADDIPSIVQTLQRVWIHHRICLRLRVSVVSFSGHLAGLQGLLGGELIGGKPAHAARAATAHRPGPLVIHTVVR